MSINAKNAGKPPRFFSAPARNMLNLLVLFAEVKISKKSFLRRLRSVWADSRPEAGPAAEGKKGVIPLPVPKRDLAAKTHKTRARRKNRISCHLLHEKITYIVY